MKYYLVKCKFGHVGRHKFLPLDVPVKAKSLKDAANNVKNCRGIKRNHKDWCLEVPKEVTYENYIEAIYIFKNDIYFEKKTRSRIKLFNDRVLDEPNYIRKNGIKGNCHLNLKTRDKEVIKYKNKKIDIIAQTAINEQLDFIYNYGF